MSTGFAGFQKELEKQKKLKAQNEYPPEPRSGDMQDGGGERSVGLPKVDEQVEYENGPGAITEEVYENYDATTAQNDESDVTSAAGSTSMKENRDAPPPVPQPTQLRKVLRMEAAPEAAREEVGGATEEEHLYLPMRASTAFEREQEGQDDKNQS